jgi:hypothetical protein
MEKFELKNDRKVFYIQAKSFPDGVLEAHQKLHALVPYSLERKYFGISRPEKENNGQIVYRAAAEELVAGELSKHSLLEFIIPKGKYVSIVVKNYMQNSAAIMHAFEKLTANPEIDPNGYCIEMYVNDTEARCMIKLKS